MASRRCAVSHIPGLYFAGRTFSREAGEPKTPSLRFGDRVRIEMFDGEGASIFGAIEQEVRRYGG